MAIDYKDYLIDADQGYDKNARSETWVLTHAVPRDTFDTDAWGSMPKRGDAAPATYPTGLGLGGTLLRRRCNFKSMPGWVLVYLTYGYEYTHLTINKGYVTTRTILVEKKRTHAYTGTTKTQVVGPKAVANDKTVTQEYDITPGAGYDDRDEEPYQIIRIHAFLNAAGLNTYVGNLLPFVGRVNSEAWTLLGKTIISNSMKYRGATTNFYRALSSTTALYTADFDFIVHPYVWQTTLKRTLYNVVTHKVDHKASDGTTIGEAIVKGRAVAANGNEATVYNTYLTHTFKTSLEGLLS